MIRYPLIYFGIGLVCGLIMVCFASWRGQLDDPDSVRKTGMDYAALGVLVVLVAMTWPIAFPVWLFRRFR